MKCKFCQAEMDETDTICPECGKLQEQQLPAEETAAELTEQQEILEETPVAETPESSAEEGAEAPAEEAATQIQEGIKATPGKIALAVVASVLVLALLVALVVGGMSGKTDAADPTDGADATEETVPATIPADGNPDDVTCKGTYTVSDEEITAAMDTVVAEMGDKKLTLDQLQAYYWAEAGAYYSQYGESAIYFGLDFTQPLDTQICPLYEDLTLTWQQFFLMCALDKWHVFNAVLNDADAEGYVPEEAFQEYVQALPENFESAAVSQGAASAQDYVSRVAGAGCSLDAYLNYVVEYNKSQLYYSEVCSRITATAEEVEAEFTENQDLYAEEGVTKDSGKYVDVRHILLMPEDENAETGEDGYPVYSDEAWAACEAEAKRIYEEWLAGDKSEDSFAQYAKDHSVDGSASVGGLYENVAKGQMVENFENWCFDEVRQVGDHGLVKTQYGYHIMFFSGSAEIWYASAEADVIEAKADLVVSAALEKHPMEVDYSKIKLGLVEMSY